MTAPITRVIIVGAGTAGWVAAAALAGENRPLAITVIDRENPARPATAESAVLSLLYFHRLLGIDERELIAATRGTFKLAVAYENWSRPQYDFFHAYSPYGTMIESIDFQHFATRLRQQGDNDGIDRYCLAAVAARRGRFAHPRTEAKVGCLSMPYALHLDSTLYCAYLRRYAEQRGVKVIAAAVADISLDPGEGNIEALDLDNGERIEGDLFIDCSGREALLIGGALGVDFTDWSRYLPCNRRLSTTSPGVGAPAPATRLRLHDNGWQRSVPLRHDWRHEYYYCSETLEDDRALANLQAELPASRSDDISVQTQVPGRRQRFWHKNCVALGAAAGFLENFAVSNLHLAQSGILRLLDLFPEPGIDPLSRDEYNSLTEEEYDRILDFHTLHYRVAQSVGSPFWQAVQNAPLPASLEHKLTLFKHTGRFPFYERETFAAKTWISFLLGHNYWPERCHPLIDMSNFSEAAEQITRMENAIAETADKMPTHRQYLDRYCPEAPAAAPEPHTGADNDGH